MRHLPPLLLPFVAVLLSPQLVVAGGSSASGSSASAPASTTHAGPRVQSPTLALTVEALSPLGGAGCFYRGRTVTGFIVTAGSFISGGLMLYALQHGDRDATILNAFAYGVMRIAGLVGVTEAGTPVTQAAFVPSSARSAWEGPVAPRVGFSYGISF